MAEEILDKIRDVVDGSIVRRPGGIALPSRDSRVPCWRRCSKDFDGQRRAEGYATLLLALSGLLAFNIGYHYQDILKAVYIGLGGTALTFLLVVPPWPLYNRNPVKWLPAGSAWQ